MKNHPSCLGRCRERARSDRRPEVGKQKDMWSLQAITVLTGNLGQTPRMDSLRGWFVRT